MKSRIIAAISILSFVVLVAMIIIYNVGVSYVRHDPVQRLHFRLQYTEWARLSEAVRAYAVSEGFIFVDKSNLYPNTTDDKSVYWDLMKNDIPIIVIHNYSDAEKFVILIYQREGQVDWQENWARLISRLNKIWPNQFPSHKKTDDSVFILNPVQIGYSPDRDIRKQYT